MWWVFEEYCAVHQLHECCVEQQEYMQRNIYCSICGLWELRWCSGQSVRWRFKRLCLATTNSLGNPIWVIINQIWLNDILTTTECRLSIKAHAIINLLTVKIPQDKTPCCFYCFWHGNNKMAAMFWFTHRKGLLAVGDYKHTGNNIHTSSLIFATCNS